MDKYEYRMKTEQMLAYIDDKAYEKAMQLADTIDWRRVKNTVILCATSEVYEQNGKFDKSRDILFIAYDRAPDNKKIIYKLGILALKQGDLSEAMDCYDEFVTVAPKDPNQYILRYKILKLQNSSVLLQIETLKTFKDLEYTERWVYELAKLYDEAGMQSECLAECDDLILWFREGEYLKEVLEIKKKYHAMSGAQENLYTELTTGRVVAPVMEMEEPAYEDNGFGDEFVAEVPYVEPVGYVEPVYHEAVVPEVSYGDEFSMGKLGDTKIIGQEELDRINSMAGDVPPVTIQLDTKAILAAENAGAKPIQIRGASVSAPSPITPSVASTVGVAAGVVAGAAIASGVASKVNEANTAGVAATAAGTVAGAASSLGSVVPTKTRSAEVSPETTGQLRIDEILTGWEEKQRAVEAAIAVEKAKGAERAAEMAKQREEEKAKKEAEHKEVMPELPEDIRRMIQDIEGGTNFEPAIPEDVVESIPEDVKMVEEIAPVDNGAVYIEEEFHDNVFEAEEEYSEFLEAPKGIIAQEVTYEEPVEEMVPVEIADEESIVIPEEVVPVPTPMEELEDIEAILARGDQQAAEATAAVEQQEAYETMSDLDCLEEHTPMSRIDAAKAVATGRTMKLPTEEIMRAAAGVSQDTGFIVQAKYDLEAQSEVGLRAGLTEEQKKLFSYFVPVRGMSEQLVDVLERDKRCVGREGTSSTGNLLIVGRKGSGKTVLAVDVVKAIQKNRGMVNGKVAIVTGEALNKKKISDIIGKLYGGALIIEKASLMNEKTITRLNKAMERETGEILVVLEDERKPLDSILATNLEFRRRFTSRLEVPVFINDELVTFGQTYAKENSYKIDEMGILALYSRIDMLQKDDYSVTVADVKDIIDEAIENSLKGGVKKFAQKLFKKDDTEDDRIILTEKYFNV